MENKKIIKQQQKSQAKRINNLFNKYENWKKTELKVTNFKEPVMFLTKRSGEIEWYENVTRGMFEFEHSDGEKRFIIVNPRTQQKFGFANKRFVGYIAHEDHPMTGWPNPLITTEQFNIIVDKSLNDMKKWKAQEIKEWTGMIKMLVYAIAIIVGGFVLYSIMKDPQPIQVVTETVVRNTTII